LRSRIKGFPFGALLLILGLALLFSGGAAWGQIRAVSGTVTKVVDGDTLHIETAEQTRLKIRLFGIDAPETEKRNHKTGAVIIPGQPLGAEAKAALEAAVMARTVRVDIMDIDKYRRMVGIVWLGNRNINLEMVVAGYAEAFLDYVKPADRPPYADAQRKARTDRRGIWALPAYERPADFRARIK
jgi:endonuclease YncB( thermonuclease family)